MWKAAIFFGVLGIIASSCQEAEPVGFNPFMEDDSKTTGDSACTWHPRTLDMPNIGQVSFTYKNCDPGQIRNESYYLDGNWVRFRNYELDEANFYPVIGVFPLNERDAETVLRQEIFQNELKNPLCKLQNRILEIIEQNKLDPLPLGFPSRWELISLDKDFPHSENSSYPCGPFAKNANMVLSDAVGGHISEKHDHIFILRMNSGFYHIDFFTVRFDPVGN